MVLETKRLVLRGWKDEDASSLFKYASDARVGPAAGWAVHESVDYSKAVIRTILAGKETYAICFRGREEEPIGSIGLTVIGSAERPLLQGEGELGFWVGVPFWGNGFAAEAAQEVIRHGFLDLGLNTIYCAYFEGNMRSKRVQEKCGFIHHHINPLREIPMLHEKRKEYVNFITYNEWKRIK